MSGTTSGSSIVKGVLTDNEKLLFESVLHKDVEDVRKLLDKSDVRINCLDENGSTPLHQAAFKGNTKICKLLLAKGAYVNSDEHDHGYTVLMFAALSGNAELCRLLLQRCAKAERRNKVNRTAAEMAAFTGPNSKPHIDSHLVPILHKLMLTYNVQPVKIALYICENLQLLEYEDAILYVLDDIMERQMKSKEANEVLVFKIHMILSTFEACCKFLHSIKGDTQKSDKEKLISYCKSLLVAKEQNFPKMLELFVRQSIKEYPYKQSTLFKQLISTLSRTEVGQHPTAIECVQQILIGQRMMSDEMFCGTFGEPRASKRCAACKTVNYCNSECQKLHWSTHKRWCAQLAGEFAKKEKCSADHISNLTSAENLKQLSNDT